MEGLVPQGQPLFTIRAAMLAIRAAIRWQLTAIVAKNLDAPGGEAQNVRNSRRHARALPSELID
ncbi:MAG: hypothetical protein ACREA2_00710 [Blastocatellia bacterium]